jgi:hypothetical protein
MAGGGGLGVGPGMDASSRGMGGLGGIGDVSMRGGSSADADSVGVENRDASRINSQALQHASQTGIDHANQNSVLAGTSTTTTVTSGALSGLTTGTTLFSNGTAVGTVKQIRVKGNGSVAVVIVQGTNGGLYAVPATKLSLSGGTLSTTARFNGINAGPMNIQARANSQGPVYASATGIAHANSHSVLAGGSTATTLTTPTTPATNSQRRLNSQGPLHASATGIAHANSHSVLAGGATATTLTTPTTPATNSQRRLNSQGPLHASATGIAHANSHSVLAGASTTTTTASMATNSQRRLNSQGPLHASATGIAHANSHSVLAGGATSTLTGVSVGMPLFSNGTQVGTVTRVVTANGVITRVLVQGTNGRTYSLAPSMLTASGGTVTTSTTLRGM